MRGHLICPKCGNDKANCICPRDSAGGSASGSESESTHKKDTVPQTILDNAKIPALSAAWYTEGETHSLAGGVADPSKKVDELTLFQAASLSKPVSAAIILDLAAQGKWALDKPLAEMGVSFGSEEMKKDKRYNELTTRMIIAQCSGLPNWLNQTPEKTFIAEPGVYFTYSGEAYECLKDVVEKKLGRTWGELAHEFFSKEKVGMEHSTFQLPSNTHLKDSTIALGYHADGTPGPIPSPDGFKEVPAASLLTTAEDYVRFLRYCYSTPSLQDLFSSSTSLDSKKPEAHQKITWGSGMGVFKDGDREIAFNKIQHELGGVDVVIYNAGSGSWGSIEEINPQNFESNWRVNALGLMLVSQQVIPVMKKKGAGSIIVIGATASKRGGVKTAAFAPAKAAQRSLAESMAKYLGPFGIHVALIIIDGVVDLPKTRERMPDKPDNFFVKPDDVADNVFWLTKQTPSTWSFEVEIRPFGEVW